MCGRFVQVSPAGVLARLLGIGGGLEQRSPRYNIAPSQSALVLREDAAEGPVAAELRWGLVPNWAKDPSIGARMINARAETAAAKPAFRAALRSRRCLVPAEGFYEWRKPAGGKSRPQPCFVHRADRRALLLAGLWESWDGADEPLESFTLLTTAAGEGLAALHHRMPVVLEPADAEVWLAPAELEVDRLGTLLRGSDEGLAFHPVSTAVNDVRRDGPELIAPVEPPARQQSLF